MSLTATHRTITISYNLRPPADTQTPKNPADSSKELTVSNSITTPVDAAGSSAKEYYQSLHSAVEKARFDVGEELTAWRDAVGKGELGKESKISDEEEEESGAQSEGAHVQGDEEEESPMLSNVDRAQSDEEEEDGELHEDSKPPQEIHHTKHDKGKPSKMHCA